MINIIKSNGSIVLSWLVGTLLKQMWRSVFVWCYIGRLVLHKNFWISLPQEWTRLLTYKTQVAVLMLSTH